MSYNSGNVSVMKEAVNALPIMKEVIEKVPLMEQVASEGTGSGIVNTSSNGSVNMPVMSKMTMMPKATMMPSIESPDYNGALAGYNPPRPGYKPAPAFDNSSNPAPAQYMVRKPVGKMTPMGYGYPGTRKTQKPAKRPVMPVRPILLRPTPYPPALTQAVDALTNVQSELNNNVIPSLNNVLAKVGEQAIMNGGGDEVEYEDEQMVRAPKMAKMAKRPAVMMKATKRPAVMMKGIKRPPVQTMQQKMIMLKNNVNQTISAINDGITKISDYLPCPTCPACPTCESSNPEKEDDNNDNKEDNTQDGGRRSRTMRSRMKKSKKTLRNRRS